MPPGPPNLGDNRFALLEANESPQSKRKKKDVNKTFSIFPGLPHVQKPNPKYIILSSADDKKPLSQYSCFSVHKSIHVISKEILSISEMRDGSLLLLLKNKLVAEKFLNSKELVGICKIKTKYHDSLNCTKGTVFAPYLNNVDEKEIVEELRGQGVTSVYKFMKKIDDKIVPSGVVLLSFDLFHLPSKIDISWRSVNVREYIPNPMRCKSCQKLGHTKNHCKNSPACVNCNLPPHNGEECTRIFCANCSADHPASAKTCKKFIQSKEILTIKTKEKCSMREAINKHKQQFPVLPPVGDSKSFSSVVARQQTQDSEKKPTTSTPTIPKTNLTSTTKTNNNNNNISITNSYSHKTSETSSSSHKPFSSIMQPKLFNSLPSHNIDNTSPPQSDCMIIDDNLDSLESV